MPQILISTAAAAIYLGGDKPFKTQTLEGWRRKGTGPAYKKIGASVRYSLEDLDAWLSAQSKQQTSPHLTLKQALKEVRVARG